MKFSAFMFQLILVKSIVFTIAGNAFGQQSERVLPVIVASTTQIADFSGQRPSG
jgi:hypothetical protein